eukprot:TRINITY_DN10950_c0_g1_i9.p2 TRINITY_DN10950_c0_g1~~TRINITY_DN10950_c0_g1_i9.p2  ORF type:complete len:335 (+),score=24.28 TRINITY_DN10950_c0_g1_i9:101-1105(+)
MWHWARFGFAFAAGVQYHFNLACCQASTKFSPAKSAAASRPKARYLVVMGGGYGDSSDTCSDKVYALQIEPPPAPPVWHQLPNLRHPRRGGVALSDQRTHILIVGGSDGREHRDDMELLDFTQVTAGWGVHKGPAVMSCAAGAALPSATMSTISDYLVAGGFDGYEALDAIHRIVVELCSPGIDVEDKTTSNDGCARFSLRVQADWDTLATPRKNATMWASPSGAAIVAGGWDGDETLGTWERIDSGGAEGYVCSTGMLRPRECHGMIFRMLTICLGPHHCPRLESVWLAQQTTAPFTVWAVGMALKLWTKFCTGRPQTAKMTDGNNCLLYLCP